MREAKLKLPIPIAMMNSTKKRILCGVLALFALVSVPKLSAQGIDVAWANSLTAMRADKWAEAHQILSKAVAQFDGRGMQLFGPKFGWFWYHKGFCELKIGRASCRERV